MKILSFLYFFGLFFPSWIRIRNLYADPDPDPTDQINADPCGSGSETLVLTVPYSTVGINGIRTVADDAFSARPKK